jgi:hypothetical protein
MHHCASTYGSSVQSGVSYLYSVREGEKRIATLELRRDGDDKVVIGQLRGRCNEKAPRKVTQAVKNWLRTTSLKLRELSERATLPNQNLANIINDDWLNDNPEPAANIDNDDWLESIPF